MRGGSDGPNWILFAGGAAVTALSYIIGRRQKHGFDDRVEELQGKSGKAQLASFNDGFESGYTSKTCSRQDSFGSVDSSSLDNSTRLGLPTGLALVNGTRTRGLDNAVHANNHQDRLQSSPSAEFSEEARSFQSRIATTPEDVRRSNLQGVQIGRTAKRDMVHRLRKQLKSRDEMILSMQVQISEYKKSLSLSDAHVSELQARLEASERSLSLSNSHMSELQARLEASEGSLSLSNSHVSELQARLGASEGSLSLSDAYVSELQARLEAFGGVLSDLDKEVQLLRNQLAELCKFDANMEDCNQPADGGAELVRNCGDNLRDTNATLLECKKLRELLDRLQDETTAREIERQALSQEHSLMLDKVDQLECALKEQKMLVFEKQQALDTNQTELVGVTSKLQDIQHLLQAQIEETESLRHSKSELEVYMHNLIKTRDTDKPEANTVKADQLIETEDTDELESNNPIANGLIRTEDIDESEDNTSISGMRLIDSQYVEEDLVKIFDSVSESGSESRDSIDSEFDEMLDGTLDDLVKICSTTVTPASTPTSSARSPNSGSKKFQYF